MKTYFYIHGYNSSIKSETVSKLKEHFPSLVALTYDQNEPEQSIVDLAKQINSYKGMLVIIGTSLGAWYAERLTKYVSAEFILYNPATDPEKTLQSLGESKEIYSKYSKITELPKNNRVVILCTDDEVIPYEAAYQTYNNKAKIVLTAGGHRIKELNTVLDQLKRLDNTIC